MSEESSIRPRVTRRAFLRAAAGLGLGLSGLAAACAPSQPPPAPTQAPAQPKAPAPAPTQAAAPAPAPTKAAAAAPTAAPAVAKAKQDLVMGVGSDVGIVDMRITRSGQGKSMIQHIVEPLLTPNDDGKTVPILVSAWEPSTNPPGWRFKLRPGIKFTNGEPLTAQAVKYALDSILDPANKSWVHPTAITRASMVKEVRVEDDLTALVVTDGFNRTFPLNTYELMMLPQKLAAEKGKEFGVNPVGTGHYKFVEYRSKSHMKVEVDPGYHGAWEGKAKNDSINFRFLLENATRVAALEAGEVHLIDNLPPDAVERVRRNSALEVLIAPSSRICMMNFNNGRAPFDNYKARLAVATAIDRQALVSKIMGGMTQLAQEPFPPGTLGTVGEKFPPLEYNPQKAKQYFAEAGLTNGAKIRLGGPVGRYTNDKQIVTAVAGMISDIGFDPQIEQLEFNTFYAKVQEGFYDMFYIGWSTGSWDPEDFVHIYGQSSQNPGILRLVADNKKVVDLFTANRTSSPQEANKPAAELAHLLWDTIPGVYLFYEPNIAGINKKLKGWKPRRDTNFYLWGSYLD